MKLSKKIKLSIVAVATVALIAGGVYAYFTSQDSVANEFTTNNEYGVSIFETFESPDNWQPGDEVPKEVKVRNNGTVPAMVRVKLDQEWNTNATPSESLPLKQNGEDVAVINFVNTDKWKKIGDYYYYYHELAAGTDTPLIIDKVTLNPNLTTTVTCNPVINEENHTYFGNCKSSGGYSNAKYTLTVSMESVQTTGLEDTWGVTETAICGSEGCTTS